ncbi:response regulator [Deltaproteobacteria bacterium TL4]
MSSHGNHSGNLNLLSMDIRMPQMDGFDATKALHAHSGCEHIPIIALTADAFLETQQKVREIGMAGYLTKPVSIDVLSDVLAQ